VIGGAVGAGAAGGWAVTPAVSLVGLVEGGAARLTTNVPTTMSAATPTTATTHRPTPRWTAAGRTCDASEGGLAGTVACGGGAAATGAARTIVASSFDRRTIVASSPDPRTIVASAA